MFQIRICGTALPTQYRTRDEAIEAAQEDVKLPPNGDWEVAHVPPPMSPGDRYQTDMVIPWVPAEDQPPVVTILAHPIGKKVLVAYDSGETEKIDVASILPYYRGNLRQVDFLKVLKRVARMAKEK